MAIAPAACTKEYPRWVPVAPLCQAMHTLEPGTPRHARGKAQGHAPSGLARGHERRGDLDLWAKRIRLLGPSHPAEQPCTFLGSPLPPLHIPCTSLLLMPVLAAQSLSRAEDVPLQLSLCSSNFILSKDAWILYRSLGPMTSATRSPTALLDFPQKNLVLLVLDPPIISGSPCTLL